MGRLAAAGVTRYVESTGADNLAMATILEANGCHRDDPSRSCKTRPSD